MNLMSFAGAFSPVARNEFFAKGKKYFAIQIFLPEKKRDKMLNELWDSLTEETWLEVAPVEVMQLQFSQKRAKKFQDAEEQADAYIKRRPKMIEYRELILQRMKEYRQKNGLMV
ncbi:hypothetical protein LCGC14_1211200 [marine sediment metagenome]|uniref:Uncharacterized protein n=1 Tax=marine sediment metagenome TaxID=412755 RepID=A0A0F9M1D1_9ZZZZ